MNSNKGDGPVKRVPPPPPPPRATRPAQVPSSNENGSRAGTFPKPPPPPVPLHSSRAARPPPPPPSKSKMQKPEPDSPFSTADIDEIDSFFKDHCPGPPPSLIRPKPVPGQQPPPKIQAQDSSPPTQKADIPAPAVSPGPIPDPEPARFDSIHISFDEEGGEAPLNVIMDGDLKTSPAAPILDKFASLFSRIYPDSDGKELRFTKEKILLDSRPVGEVSFAPGNTKATIWLHELGYTMPMLPTSLIAAIDTEFRAFPGFIANALKSNSYISIVAEQTEMRTGIRICFHKSMNSPPSSSAPIRSL